MAEERLNQKDSRAAKIYKAASELEEATAYALRFERKVEAYQGAAKKFQSIAGYQDADQRAEQCLRQAESAEQEGLEEAFALGERKEREARSKSDYLDAIGEFRRVWKQEAYSQKAREHISICKKAIERLQKRTLWKRRGIALAVFALMVLVFVNTDAYPFTKGMIHQATGEYKLSIANFREGMGVPWAKGKMKKSYFYLGQKYLEAGKKTAALRAFRKAENTLEAPEEAAKLEQEEMAQTQVGDEIRFGRGRWLVLEKKKNKVLLLYKKKGTRMVYNMEEIDRWEDSKIYAWLNSGFAGSMFSDAERELSSGSFEGGDTAGCATLLTERELEKYREYLGEYSRNWWLKDLGASPMEARYVDAQGNVSQTYVNSMKNCVRPAVWVTVK